MTWPTATLKVFRDPKEREAALGAFKETAKKAEEDDFPLGAIINLVEGGSKFIGNRAGDALIRVRKVQEWNMNQLKPASLRRRAEGDARRLMAAKDPYQNGQIVLDGYYIDLPFQELNANTGNADWDRVAKEHYEQINKAIQGAADPLKAVAEQAALWLRAHLLHPDYGERYKDLIKAWDENKNHPLIPKLEVYMRVVIDRFMRMFNPIAQHAMLLDHGDYQQPERVRALAREITGLLDGQKPQGNVLTLQLAQTFPRDKVKKLQAGLGTNWHYGTFGPPGQSGQLLPFVPDVNLNLQGPWPHPAGGMSLDAIQRKLGLVPPVLDEFHPDINPQKPAEFFEAMWAENNPAGLRYHILGLNDPAVKAKYDSQPPQLRWALEAALRDWLFRILLNEVDPYNVLAKQYKVDLTRGPMFQMQAVAGQKTPDQLAVLLAAEHARKAPKMDDKLAIPEFMVLGQDVGTAFFELINAAGHKTKTFPIEKAEFSSSQERQVFEKEFRENPAKILLILGLKQPVLEQVAPGVLLKQWDKIQDVLPKVQKLIADLDANPLVQKDLVKKVKDFYERYRLGVGIAIQVALAKVLAIPDAQINAEGDAVNAKRQGKQGQKKLDTDVLQKHINVLLLRRPTFDWLDIDASGRAYDEQLFNNAYNDIVQLIKDNPDYFRQAKKLELAANVLRIPLPLFRMYLAKPKGQPQQPITPQDEEFRAYAVDKKAKPKFAELDPWAYRLFMHEFVLVSRDGTTERTAQKDEKRMAMAGQPRNAIKAHIEGLRQNNQTAKANFELAYDNLLADPRNVAVVLNDAVTMVGLPAAIDIVNKIRAIPGIDRARVDQGLQQVINQTVLLPLAQIRTTLDTHNIPAHADRLEEILDIVTTDPARTAADWGAMVASMDTIDNTIPGATRTDKSKWLAARWGDIQRYFTLYNQWKQILSTDEDRALVNFDQVDTLAQELYEIDDAGVPQGGKVVALMRLYTTRYLRANTDLNTRIQGTGRLPQPAMPL